MPVPVRTVSRAVDDGLDGERVACRRCVVDVGAVRSAIRPHGLSAVGRYSSWKIAQICGRGDLAALGVGLGLDDPGELDLQAARQVQLVVGLQDVGDAALAGLRVDPDDRLVGAADVLGVDRQVRHGPLDARRR